jgi:hypothetical protein
MLYLELYIPDSFDHLSNDQYIKLKAEPLYTLLVVLHNILPKDIIRFMVQYNLDYEPVDLTGRTIRRLCNSIETGQFKEFQTIFDTEYMHNPLISNYFEYFDSPRYIEEWNFYSLCECRTCCNDEYFCKLCQPKTLLQDFCIKECKCLNGKRYLAFQLIYRFAYEIINIPNGKKDKKGKKIKHYNAYQLMVDHVIASGPIDFKYNPLFET